MPHLNPDYTVWHQIEAPTLCQIWLSVVSEVGLVEKAKCSILAPCFGDGSVEKTAHVNNTR